MSSLALEPVAGARAGFRDATRVLTSVLATVERRCLIWMASRLPARVNSDHLTALAVVAMAAAGASYWWARVEPRALGLVVVCLAVNWFGDSLDGTLARVRRQQRPRYGFYVDHAVDCVGATLLLGGLALSGYMHPAIAAGLLIAFLLLSAEAYLSSYCLQTFRISFFKVGPTELRILLAIGSLALLWHPRVHWFGRDFQLFDVGGAIGIAGMLATFLVAIVSNTRRLALTDPRPPRPVC